jgi:hypothetical protein
MNKHTTKGVGLSSPFNDTLALSSPPKTSTTIHTAETDASPLSFRGVS